MGFFRKNGKNEKKRNKEEILEGIYVPNVLSEFAKEIEWIHSLDDDIKFSHSMFADKHQRNFHEMKAWYIEAQKKESPNGWEKKIEELDNEILALKEDEARMVHFINEKVMNYYIKRTKAGKTKVKWDENESKEFTDFIKWLLESSKEFCDMGKIPPGLGGVSVNDLPEWYIKWIAYIEKMKANN